MARGGGRDRHPDRHGAPLGEAVRVERDVLTWLGLALVGAAAAVLSFAALRDLAIRCDVPPHLAWLLPLTVDLLAAITTRVWLRRRAHPDAQRYARGLAIGAILATVTGNAAHGYLVSFDVTPPWWAVVIVSAVPAAALGFLVHLAVLVGRDPAEEPRRLRSWPRPADRDEDDGAGDDEGVPGETLEEKRERLLRAGAGRRRLARELDISEHDARTLLENYRAGGAA